MTVAPGALPRATSTAAAGVPVHAAGSRRTPQPPGKRTTPASPEPSAPPASASPASPACAEEPAAGGSPTPDGAGVRRATDGAGTSTAGVARTRTGQAPAAGAREEPVEGTGGASGTRTASGTGTGTGTGTATGARTASATATGTRTAPGEASAGGGSSARYGEPGRSGSEEGEIDGVDEALALVSGPGRMERGPGPTEHRAAAGRAGHGGTGSGTGTGAHRASPWEAARSLAAGAGRSRAPRTDRAPLARALGGVLAEPLVALCDLPSFDTSAMDGWAVAGPGPWRIASGESVLAGHGSAAALPDGTALRIATGARVPPETTAVIRSEHARAEEGKRLLHAERPVTPGQDIRPRGQECRTGDRLLPAGTVVTPAVLGLAAAAGYDTLVTVVRPRAEVLVLGDELLTEGLPHDGLIRDALGPMIGPWLSSLGADVVATRRIGDDADALHRAVTASDADLVVTTGGTAAGPVDHVHPVLRRAGAELLVDQVAVRPGHPMLLARLAGGRHLVGLPGNPLAAVSGLLTLVEPLLRVLSGREPGRPPRLPVREAVQGHPHDTRLVPFVYDRGRPAPLRYNGPAMLRGVAAADGLLVIGPGGAEAGDDVEVLDLPWAGRATVEGGCFT